MTKFTIEDLRDIAYRGSHDDLERELALQLLASMEQEPVAYMVGDYSLLHYQDPKVDEYLGRVTPLYAAPQLPQPAVGPQPVSAVKGELGFIDHLERIIGERDEDIDIGQLGRRNYDALMLAALDAFRAAMLQGAEPVRQANKLPDWQAEAEKMAELHGSSFVVFRSGAAPQCADPSKVVISFTHEGLGHGSAAPQQEVQ